LADTDVVDNWLYSGPKQQGDQFKFTDSCITRLLQLKAVYKLPYRQLEGFINSIFRILNIDYKSTSYTQICRRAKSVEADIDATRITGQYI